MVKRSIFLKSDSILHKFFNFLAQLSIWVVVFASLYYTWKYPDVVQKIFPGLELPSVNLSNILQALVFMSIVLYVFRFFKKMIVRWVEKHPKEDKGVYYSLIKFVGYIGWVIALWGTLSFLGLKLQNLAIVLGALSVGIGFGMQNIINNFISGLLLLFERPIAVGDWIKVGSQEGIVKNIRIRATELETFDKSSVLIPNSSILSGEVVNITKPNRLGRIIVSVGVSYDSDMENVRKILLNCIKKTDGILSDPEPRVFMTEFADNCVQFEARLYVEDVGTCAVIRSSLMFSIWNTFKENNIEIPFPQRVVHIQK